MASFLLISRKTFSHSRGRGFTVVTKRLLAYMYAVENIKNTEKFSWNEILHSRTEKLNIDSFILDISVTFFYGVAKPKRKTENWFIGMTLQPGIYILAAWRMITFACRNKWPFRLSCLPHVSLVELNSYKIYLHSLNTLFCIQLFAY